ncbi:MAG: PAS domain S-box protein [Deltaproteobacteria bacterium]|nr:PAS domain S-box protein [Deltaproteobacteria bacterium]
MARPAQTRTLADVVADRTSDIIRRWTDRVARDRPKAELATPELVDHIPEFLAGLVESLRHRRPADTTSSGPSTAAHARLRLREGFRLDDAMDEFGALGDAICEIAADEGVLLHPWEASVLNDSLKLGISTAASLYLRYREDEVRRSSTRPDEARFLASFEEAPLGLAHIALNGEWLEVNQRFCEILGYRRDELIGRSGFVGFTHPDDLGEEIALAEEMLGGRSSRYTVEKRYVRKDRSIVWVELTASLVRTPSGAPDYYVAAALDISARRRLESERARAAVRVETLSHTSRALSRAGLDVHEVLSAVVHEVAERIGDACALRLSLEDEQGLHPTAGHHTDPEARALIVDLLSRSRQRKDEGLHGRIAQTAAPVFMPHATFEALRASSSTDYWPYIDRFRPHSVIGVPLMLGGEVIGSLVVLRDRTPEPLLQEDVTLMEEIARRVAVAVENSRLYQRALAATRRMSEREAELRILIETLQEGVIVQDVSGAIRVANSGAERLLGLSREQLEARTSHDPEWRAIHEDGTPFAGEEHPAMVTLRTGEPQTGVVMGVQHPGGRRVWLMINSSPLRTATAGGIAGVVVSFFDITETREAKRAVDGALERERAARARVEEAADQLRDAVRLREEFLQVASHELKTPLTPLDLRLHALERLARKSPDEALAAKIGADVAGMRKHVQRLTALIDDMLDVGRIANRKLALHPERVDAVAVVREVVAMFEHEAARAGTPVHVDAPSGIEVTWDRLRVDQVFTNLLSNALKYGAGSPIDVTVVADDSMVRVSVRDQGIGISEDAHDRIFRKFERAVSERNYGGLGLGLFIAHEFVRAMGGTLRVQSAPGRGATFTVELPRDTRR